MRRNGNTSAVGQHNRLHQTPAISTCRAEQCGRRTPLPQRPHFSLRCPFQCVSPSSYQSPVARCRTLIPSAECGIPVSRTRHYGRCGLSTPAPRKRGVLGCSVRIRTHHLACLDHMISKPEPCPSSAREQVCSERSTDAVLEAFTHTRGLILTPELDSYSAICKSSRFQGKHVGSRHGNRRHRTRFAPLYNPVNHEHIIHTSRYAKVSR